MTATPPRHARGGPPVAGAASHDIAAWQTINWSKAHRIVRRLQARIVQATQAGRWGKVKALQRLLTHSYSGKVVAVRRVTENHGKRTPGVDQRSVEHAREEGNGGTAPAAAGLPCPTAAARVHRETNGHQTSPPRHSDVPFILHLLQIGLGMSVVGGPHALAHPVYS